MSRSSGSVKSLTVGLVLDDSLDRPDGVQQMVLGVGTWLASRGHDVHYIVSETKRTDVPHVHSVARSSRVAFNGNVLRIPHLARKTRLMELCNTYEFDVLHVQMPYSPLMSGRLIAATNIPLVGTFHILPYGRLAHAGTRVLGAFQAETLRKFSRTSATSEAARRFAADAYRVDPMVIPNPVDIAAFSSPARKAVPHSSVCRIVFLGRLVERKGALHLLRAVAGLSPDVRKSVRVDIGGTGPDLGNLQRFVRNHELESVVTFRGFIEEAAKPSFLSAADIAVFPSVAGESFGIVLLEAMAAGAGVVLGGNNPGYACVLGDWPECLVDPADTEKFSDTLARFVQDVKLRTRIGTAQHTAVKRYDISVVGAQFEQLYKQAILESRQDLA